MFLTSGLDPVYPTPTPPKHSYFRTRGLSVAELSDGQITHSTLYFTAAPIYKSALSTLRFIRGCKSFEQRASPGSQNKEVKVALIPAGLLIKPLA